MSLALGVIQALSCQWICCIAQNPKKTLWDFICWRNQLLSNSMKCSYLCLHIIRVEMVSSVHVVWFSNATILAVSKILVSEYIKSSSPFELLSKRSSRRRLLCTKSGVPNKQTGCRMQYVTYCFRVQAIDLNPALSELFYSNNLKTAHLVLLWTD